MGRGPQGELIDFVDLFGADLIVVPGSDVASKVETYHRHLAQQASPGAEPPAIPSLDLPDDILAADSVAIHCIAEEGLSFYPDYHLLEELFSNLALISAAATHLPRAASAARRPRSGQGRHGLHPAPRAQTGLPLGDRRGDCCASTNPATSTARCCPEGLGVRIISEFG